MSATGATAITAENMLKLFPDIDTTSEALEGHDEEQIRLMDEVCIVTDDNDQPIGNASKKLCMFGPHCLSHLLLVAYDKDRPLTAPDGP